VHAIAALARAVPARRARAVAALLSDTALPAVVRHAALELTRGLAGPQIDERIVQLTGDQSPTLRASALAELTRRFPERVRAVLMRSLANQAGDVATRSDALRRLARLTGATITAALGAALMDETLPISERVWAARVIVRRRQGAALLLALVDRSSAAAPLRAGALLALAGAAARERRRPLYGPRDSRRAASERQWKVWLARRRRSERGLARQVMLCCEALLVDHDGHDGHDGEPLMALAACQVLTRLGSSAAGAALLGVLQHGARSSELLCAAAGGLGALRLSSAVPALAALLGQGAHARLQGSVPEGWLRETSQRCLESGALPEALAGRLEYVLACALTPAEQPTILSEFLIAEAEHVIEAVALALARISTPDARSALAAALAAGGNGASSAAVARALAQLDQGCEALGYILTDPGVDGQTRWQAAQTLADAPGADRVVLSALARQGLDAFTCGLVVEAAGRRRLTTALPMLEQLAQDRAADQHVREQALAAIGMIGDVLSEPILVAIAADDREQPDIRGQAAAQLPPGMSVDARRVLRSALRSERPPERLAVGAIQALGRARDREALPALLRSILDERPLVVRAAIDALAAIGDTSVAPALVRLSQEPAANRAVRLQAIGALMRLDDQDHSPLLRAYLNASSVPMQLQALEQLIAAGATAQQLAPLLADRDRSLPFRARIIEQLAALGAGAALVPLARDRDEPVLLRGRAARGLGHGSPAETAEALAEIVLDGSDHSAVRMAAAQALVQSRARRLPAVLSQLAGDAQAPRALRSYAERQLIGSRILPTLCD
jgi:HEAT repeat protein